jgi:hypothetical protein
MKKKALPRSKMMNQAGATKMVAVVAVATTLVMLELNLNTMILLPRLTSSIEMLELLLYHHCEKNCKFMGCDALSEQLCYKS